MTSELVESVKNLPLAKRIELIDAIWESIAAEGFEPSLTPEQAKELDRRLEAHRQHPEDVVSWESMKEEPLNRYPHR